MLDAFIYDTSSVQDRLLQAAVQKEKESLLMSIVSKKHESHLLVNEGAKEA